jgi:serine/threonine-protein kinase
MESAASVGGVREGDVLAGKYRIDKVLGVGGMGVVVAAHHVQLETKVAIKFLLPEMLANREAVDRFAREARAAVKITGEHVARVLDVGTLETGAPYMVMEYLDGGDLAGWLQQRGALPFDQAVEFVLQASVAVAEAHALGIVHRDLKPANLFCVRRADGKPSVKVLDFGISKMNDLSTSGGMSATKTSTMMGSPLYMSPEQMQSTKDVDQQTDVWALGVILYELVTGRVPFNGESLPDIAIKVAMTQPAPVRSLRPEVPAGLEAVIAKCLEKQKANRYANVSELAKGLLEFAPRHAKQLVERICGIQQIQGPNSTAPDPMPPMSGTGPVVIAQTMGGVGRTTAGMSGEKKKPPVAIVGAALLLVAGIGVTAVVIGKKGHASPDPGTAMVQTSTPVAATAPPALPPPPTGGSELVPLPTADVALTAPPPTKTAPTDARPSRPGKEARGSATRPTASTSGTKPAAAAPAAAPAPAKPAQPAQSRNPMDLGNFQ